VEAARWLLTPALPPLPRACPTDELHVRTTLRIGGREVAYTQVYRRKGS
jgi:hypothetical protein